MRYCLPVLLLAVALGPGTATAADPANDIYLRGYATALLEREFQLVPRTLNVREGVITLDVADLGSADRQRVAAALATIPGVVRVEIRDPPVATPAPPAPEVPRPRTLPELDLGFMPRGDLFNALIADPRWPHFSIAYQYYVEDPDFKNIAAISFGETFTVYRDRIGQGWWELGLHAGVFAVFDLDAESYDLINSDYFVAAAVAYRYRNFSAQARLFHQSSHLGDEFLLRQTRPERLNLSYEGVDLKLSYEAFNEAVRLYAGGGYLFHREPATLEPWFTQAGVEVRSPWPRPGKGWRPIAAVDVQNREENRWATDISIRAGVEFSGVLAPRNLQVLIEYFTGHSPNGQFYRNAVDYLGLGLHFHF